MPVHGVPRLLTRKDKLKPLGARTFALLLSLALPILSNLPAEAHSGKHASWKGKQLLALGLAPGLRVPAGRAATTVYRMRHSSALKHHRIERGAFTPLVRTKAKANVKAPAPKAAQPAKPVVRSHAASSMKEIGQRTLSEGVIYKVFDGGMSAGHVRINLIDVDMSRSPCAVRPMTASYSFAGLKDVREHSRDANAIAAVNANYFKSNGVALGTLIQDGDWLAGPLYDRVSLGFTEGGYARIAKVRLSGIAYTDSVSHPKLFINNVNQPRRTGSHCILYTRRWGSTVSLPYPGCLIAVDGSGKVVDRDELKLTIPYGGFVLADSRGTAISHLAMGETLNVKWHIDPPGWSNVVEAVSGGPLLVTNGKIALDLKSEKFPQSFAGSHIQRRTACAITADDHLLMATFEGAHTLYDVSKFFIGLGASEAMNLDGGGSTTMVVDGKTVTRNANAAQRHVAVALGVFTAEKARNLTNFIGSGYRPRGDLTSFVSDVTISAIKPVSAAGPDPLMDSLITSDVVSQVTAEREAAKFLPQVMVDPLDYSEVVSTSPVTQESSQNIEPKPIESGEVVQAPANFAPSKSQTEALSDSQKVIQSKSKSAKFRPSFLGEKLRKGWFH